MSDHEPPFRSLSRADLDRAFPEPEPAARTKKRPDLGLTARRFIAHSPFVCLATRSSDGADCSPRGDAPGFTRVLSDHLLALPDRTGNNLADSFRNVVEDPAVGLLFLVPGVVETLRVNGTATVTDDPRVLERFESGSRPIRLALLVEIEEVFFHCGKAILRSDLWGTPRQDPHAVAMGSNVFALENCERPHLDMSVSQVKELLRDGYQSGL